MERQTTQRGVTLIELLVTLLVLSLVLAGIYGLLNSAHQVYLKTRAMTESQQTARVVMNYLTFRLREIDGGGSGALSRDPRYCTECHRVELDDEAYNNDPANDDAAIPCVYDVLVPRPNLFLENLTTDSSGIPRLRELNTIADIPGTIDPIYKNLSGSPAITFWADLLPIQGVSDTFVDSDDNQIWELTQDNGRTGKYDRQEADREMLFYDYNDNGLFDYYGERWTFRLMTSVLGSGVVLYELGESLSFRQYSSMNRSVYSTYLDTQGTVYTDQPVAYGLTGLGFKLVPKYTTTSFGNILGGAGVAQSTTLLGSRTSCVDGCHNGGNPATTGPGDFGSEAAGDFEFVNFVQTHPWWNIQAVTVEIATTDPSRQQFLKMKQFVIPRNLEVNNR